MLEEERVLVLELVSFRALLCLFGVPTLPHSPCPQFWCGQIAMLRLHMAQEHPTCGLSSADWLYWLAHFPSYFPLNKALCQMQQCHWSQIILTSFAGYVGSQSAKGTWLYSYESWFQGSVVTCLHTSCTSSKVGFVGYPMPRERDRFGELGTEL